MENTVETEKLTAEISRLKQQVEALTEQLRWFMEQLKNSRRRQFGVSSEQMSQVEQLSLLQKAEAETPASEPASAPELEKIKEHYRRVSKTRLSRMPANLPVEIIEHELPPGKRQ